ncbi:LysR family transcriptional regulator [Halomonas sp. PA16-9]|uniref:LysR family transcriptional regulator n=1 Tax=Halomonas sp. PA16-9 TaxID=2576841 RepID=UPI0030EC9C95
MRAEQVQAFIDVTEHGSFAAAARHTGLKRSTLSAAVNALEDSLGVALFERSGNSLTLTAVGDSVLPDCYRLLTSASRIKNTATSICRALKANSASPVMTPCPRCFGVR